MMNWDDPLAVQATPEPAAKPPVVEETAAVYAPQSTAPAQTMAEQPLQTQPNDTLAQSPQLVPQPAQPVTEKPAKAKKPTAAAPAVPDFDQISADPVKTDDKRVVNGMADINQLAPFKYPWAWKYFLNANKNHWTPLDINMTQDVHDYNHKLTLEERHVYENVLSYLTTSDILAMRNIGLAVMEKMSAPELQIYQARQVYEESMHTWTYQHCIETIGLDQGEIYNRYRVVPEIYGKIKIANQRLNSVLRSDIDLRDRDELENFVMAYTFFAGIFEGTWFYNGFTPIFALQRRGLMKGTAEQLQYIMRDEVMHASFGIRVCKQIIEEEKVKLDPKAIQQMWEEAEAAEEAYSKNLLPEPILGYKHEDHVAQFRFVANRRAKSLGHKEPFPGAENTLPWLDEQANLKKEKNFFETRVTEYQTGGALSWD
ncbi:MAG: ribonucleotide-diphosphate reductase subunit beta [Gammaproteobacteria bacterium]|nr:ribonucleotide-diphosphate reductase subunit beta [Gammaproteobacteria bacterium]